jgi:hypothetical protein
MMRKFIIKVSSFIFVTIVLFVAVLFSLPPTFLETQSMLYAAIKKDSLLLNEPSPRIIFVGGSNLSFGLNSQMIKDSLGLNPINTAISAGIGIRYMLENTLQYVRKGDIIVFAPEYNHFCYEWDRGSNELLHTVLDTDKSKVKLLSLKQIIDCVPFIGNFIISKLSMFDFHDIEKSNIYGAYGVNSFNQYGDTYLHWNMQKEDSIIPDTGSSFEKYNPKVIEKVKKYNRKIQEKGAFFLISYPGYQDFLYRKSEEVVKKVEQEYIEAGFTILGTPERYRMPDSLLFDTSYHLNKTGVDYRTKLLIEDLRKDFFE